MMLGAFMFTVVAFWVYGNLGFIFIEHLKIFIEHMKFGKLGLILMVKEIYY